MSKRVVATIATVFFLGHLCLSAQDISRRDTLKIEHQITETVESDFIPLSLPDKLEFNESGPETPQSKLNTDSWNMQFHAPALPWGLQGSNTYSNFIGLGASQDVTIAKDLHYGNFGFNTYSFVQKHSYDYRTATLFVVGASATYTFSPQWSATIFGRYASNPGMMFSPAIQSMMPLSNYGGYATYTIDNFSISGGVRREFNPYTNSWETYPIIMPQVKIGDMKIGVDVGPAIMKEVQRHNNQVPPPPPPSR